MTKQYGVILADPPWSYSNGGNGAAKNHYSTMTDKGIAALPVNQFTAPDCVLIMWANWAKLDIAFQVMTAWGFTYKSGFPWVKLQDDPRVDMFGEMQIGSPTFGTGFWVRGCSEPILIGTKGGAKYPDGTHLGLISKRFPHSRKPENIHVYAESMPGPYLELFARRPHPGWDVWGNEVESDIKLEAAS